MSNFLQNIPFVANSNIAPSVFVMVDPTRDNAVVQASGTAFLVGISQAGTEFPVNLPAALGGTNPAVQPAAVPGMSIGVFTVGDFAPIKLGGSVASGDLLTNKSDTSGTAVTATSGTFYGALAVQSGATGEVISALVCCGKLP